MFANNKELRLGLILILIFSFVLTAIGFWIWPVCGVLVLLSSLILGVIHLATEYYRYRRLQKLSQDLDALLVSGTPLPIRDYDEGELSMLANQIQKMTLRMMEAAEAVTAEKVFLADSLADISHQLRTPLTAMNLTAAMLRQPELPEEKRIALTGELRSLLTRTQWLVESLLKLSRLDAGTVVMESAKVSVSDMVRQASKPLTIPMELRNQKLTVHCAGESFTGDLVWTAEALGNVLKNCMEHTPDGGSITVNASETPLYTAITVEDTGPGFDTKELPRLFERFYKGAQASENSYGIGLALARTVITAQNGTIQAMNGNQGAKFVIKFYKQVI